MTSMSQVAEQGSGRISPSTPLVAEILLMNWMEIVDSVPYGTVSLNDSVSRFML